MERDFFKTFSSIPTKNAHQINEFLDVLKIAVIK